MTEAITKGYRTATLEDFLAHEGRVDVGRIISEGRLGEVFPGLLPLEFVEREYPQMRQYGGTYVDITGTSQTPSTVLERIYHHRITTPAANTHSDSRASQITAGFRENTTRLLKELLHIDNTWEVAYTSNESYSAQWVTLNFPFDKGDSIFVTEGEHHSQLANPIRRADRESIPLSIIPITVPDGRLDMAYLENLLGEVNKVNKDNKHLFYIIHASNVTGVINPIKIISSHIREKLPNAYIYLDAAASVPHIGVDLKDLGVDMAGLSAHKMSGTHGVGALVLSPRAQKLFESRNNNTDGGGTVNWVTRETIKSTGFPGRVELGTPPLTQIIEWGYHLGWLKELGQGHISGGVEKLGAHERELSKYLLRELSWTPGVTVLGPTNIDDRCGPISFYVGPKEFHTHRAIASAFEKAGIDGRSGRFCADLLIAKLLGASPHEMRVACSNSSSPGAYRVSFGPWNTIDDAKKVADTIYGVAKDYYRISIKQISHKEAEARISQGGIVVDVRSAEEYLINSPIPGSRNIPLAYLLNGGMKLLPEDRTTPILVVSAADRSAIPAINHLSRAGYTEVAVLNSRTSGYNQG